MNQPIINTQPTPHSTAILLCTYNGDRFLQKQLDSFTSQIQRNWKLFVYDDASTDNTCDIISQYQLSISNSVFLQRNITSKGFCKNFLSAICTAPHDSADFFALSDQDDIWKNDKLIRAVGYLSQYSSEIPVLYCSRTETVDQNLKHLGFSPLFSRKPSFNNALVQSIAGGNTMVFNKAAKKLIAQAGSNIDVISHDWWIYLLISGHGGHVFYDTSPTILYRQHGNNLIGSNNHFMAKLTRLNRLLKGQFKTWNDKNILALNGARTLLTPENSQILDNFVKGRKSAMFDRFRYFYKAHIYRQTLSGNLGLFIATALNKI